MIRFLGSIYLAIVLIITAALLVIAGTFIEAGSDSHQLASKWIYSNPLFVGLLIGFFINILMATLTRYPFKTRHIPFILTHIGLLMVIGGTILKLCFGLQGVIRIHEGTGSHAVQIVSTQAIVIQEVGHEKKSYPLKGRVIKHREPQDPLSIQVISYASHSKIKWHSWIKDEKLDIMGLPQLPVGKNLKTPFFEVTTIPSDQKPNICVIEDQFYATSALGETFHKSFENLNSLFAYNDGYGGYTVGVDLPFLIDSEEPWYSLDKKEQLGSYWVWMLFQNINPNLPLKEALTNIHCPITEEDPLLLAKQVYLAGQEMPADIDAPIVELLNIYYAINSTSKLSLETALAYSVEPIPPHGKMEDLQPMITVQLDNEQQETHTLFWNNELPWPILKGRYLAQFKPHVVSIPYHIRLRSAKTIDYPNSNQAMSYEANVIVTNRKTGKKTEAQISPNKVLETDDGYRFYLSSISPPRKGVVKTAQFAVNYDPAKSYLTYPGAAILSIGIVLLWIQSRVKRLQR